VLRWNLHGRKVRGDHDGLSLGGQHLQHRWRVLFAALLRRPLSARFLVLHPDQRRVLAKQRMLFFELRHPDGKDARHLFDAAVGADLLQGRRGRHRLRRLQRMLQ
jgi:hypothetical protein